MSNTSDDQAAVALGQQLHSLRKARGLSLRALASEVEVTASFLSQVERGLCSPSLASLRQLARVFEVPVFQLLVELDVGHPVVRSGERVTIQLPEAPVVYELLSSGTARAIEMFIVRVETPHVNLVRRLSTPTEECLHVITGTMNIEFGNENYTLNAGDSVTCDGMALVSIMSVTDEPLVMVVAVTPPSF
jgi:transcriptional regulator with XRE-family HTH domain